MLKSKKRLKGIKKFCVWALVIFFGVTIVDYFLSDESYLASVLAKINATASTESFEVDMVYLWCDGNEPKFREQKNYWLIKENKAPEKQATAAGRFEQVDELKYSLRSVEKYLPWVRHVYIVTADQVPSWLNTEYSKVTVVDHSEILPRENLPVFNSNAIEAGIYKIPGLSEHFLYANDDTFVNRPLKKSFFFEDGKPIVRVKPTELNTTSLYHLQLSNAIELGEQFFGSEIPLLSQRNLVPHHNIDAYLKSDYAACAAQFDEQYQETLTHRFRKAESVQRLLVSIWSIMKDHAQVKIVQASKKKTKTIDSLYIVNTKRDYARTLNRMNPGLFCINDSEFSGPNDRQRVKKFLKNRFPHKSKFEK